MNEYKLNREWILWYHGVNDKKWDLESYKKIGNINTIYDYNNIINSINSYVAGMFFIIQDGIMPRWEDKYNIKGGVLTLKISKKKMDEIWVNLIASLIGETLTEKEEDMKYINGLSISPKINNVIIKIWFNKSDLNFNTIISSKLDYLKGIHTIFKKYNTSNF